MSMHSGTPQKPVRGARWWVVRAVAALGVVAVGSAAFGVVAGDDDRRGEVVRIVDGDTLVALVDGEETTIRLLNIDTPETKDPDEPIQCLGTEATAFLADRLPAGTEIELDYDEERLDRYDRTLAAVYESESLINAEIAAAGLGVPVYFAPNDRFLPEVEAASRSAQDDGTGLFSSEIECTIPAQLQVQNAAVEAVPATVTGDPADALAGATAVVEGVDLFIAGISVTGLPGSRNAVLASPYVEDHLEGIREDASELHRRAVTAEETLEERKREYDAEQERREQERREREEQERKEREEEERTQREEEERQEREREEREQREREEQQSTAPKAPAQQSSGSSSPAKSSSGSSGSSSSEQTKGSSSGSSSGGSKGSSSSGGSAGGSSGSSGSSCDPYGPEISYSDDGGYTGKRHGMPGGKTFRKCR